MSLLLKMFLLVGLLFVCTSRPIVYLQASNKQSNQFQNVHQLMVDYLYQNSGEHLYNVFFEDLSQQNCYENIKQDFQIAVSKANYVLVYIQQNPNLQFFKVLSSRNIPVYTFQQETKEAVCYIENCHFINLSQKPFTVRKSNSKNPQQLKSLLLNYTTSKNIPTKLFEEHDQKLGPVPLQSFTQPQIEDKYSFVVIIMSQRVGGGYYVYMTNLVDILKHLGTVDVVMVAQNQKISPQQLDKYDFIFIQDITHQYTQSLMSKTKKQTKKRVFWAPFALMDGSVNFYKKNYVEGSRKFTYMQLLEHTTIIVENAKYLQMCRNRSGGKFNCIQINQGVNVQEWKPFFQRYQKRTPLIYYKQRPRQAQPISIRRTIESNLIKKENQYAVIITKNKHEPGKKVAFKNEQYQIELLRAKYLIAYTALQTYGNFLFQAWSMDVPMLLVTQKTPYPIIFEEKFGLQFIHQNPFGQLEKEKFAFNYQIFLENLNNNKYKPREAILLHHSRQMKSMEWYLLFQERKFKQNEKKCEPIDSKVQKQEQVIGNNESNISSLLLRGLSLLILGFIVIKCCSGKRNEQASAAYQLQKNGQIRDETQQLTEVSIQNQEQESMEKE